MKNRLFPLIIIGSFLAFFFTNFGRAQEFIDELYFFKEDYSIVREVASQKWLLGSNFQGHQTILLVDLSGTANCISRGDGYNKYLIKDIEIVDSRYVYYCGTRVVGYILFPTHKETWCTLLLGELCLVTLI